MISLLHQEEKEQLNEFKTHVAGLNKRAKTIIQLKPRNPTKSIKGKLPIQAVCDFKQMEVIISSLSSHFEGIWCRNDALPM